MLEMIVGASLQMTGFHWHCLLPTRGICSQATWSETLAQASTAARSKLNSILCRQEFDVGRYSRIST